MSAIRLRWLCAALLLLAGLAGHAAGADVYPDKSWEKAASPEAANWSGAKLTEADDFARSLQTSSYMVVQHGLIVHEFGDTSKPHNIHSMRKSILSVLMGMYADQGVVDLESSLSALGINDKGGLTDAERRATVQQLLEARSGVYHPAAYETSGMAARRPARGSFEPGANWYYNNWDFNALGTIFKGFTGKTVFESLRDDLAGPLQFEDFDYSTDTHWVFDVSSEHPAYVMRISARDMARVGLLMARGGQWHERQLVSRHWVEESTHAYSKTAVGRFRIGYGYLWWIGVDGSLFGSDFPGESFSAIGNHGQYVLVVPALDLVIAHNVESGGKPPDDVSMSQFAKLLSLIMAAAPPGH